MKEIKNPNPFTLMIKGHNDLIIGKNMAYRVSTPGGNKRCGGVGDILAGVTAACSLWDFELGPVLASRIVRKATRMAF